MVYARYAFFKKDQVLYIENKILLVLSTAKHENPVIPLLMLWCTTEISWKKKIDSIKILLSLQLDTYQQNLEWGNFFSWFFLNCIQQTIFEIE